jgi:hypothetical protein
MVRLGGQLSEWMHICQNGWTIVRMGGTVGNRQNGWTIVRMSGISQNGWTIVRMGGQLSGGQ